MGILVPIRPLSSTGREPGTRPDPNKGARGSVHDQNESRWQSDIPLALANLALARELAGRPLTTKAALEVLKRTSIRVPPELAKRQALQNAGLFCPVSTATAGGQWDLTAEGAECLRDSGRVPSLTPEAIHAILARHQRPTP